MKLTGVIVCLLLSGVSSGQSISPGEDSTRAAANDSAGNLQQVIVTALGVRTSKRSVGYSTQQLNGEEVRRSREGNLITALSGRVAGLQVTSSAGTPGASAYIKLRGASSMLGKADNAIASNGDPLWVIDGVPVDNSQFIYRGNAISDLKDVTY